MIPARAALICVLALIHCAARGEESVSICYNYGCLAQAEIRYTDAQLAAVRAMLADADTAERERMRLAVAVGELYAWAGRQSPIHNDRGGDYADGEVDGRMDCVDHATSTTRLLRMLERRGWLRFHRVLDPVRRPDFPFRQHFSAAIEEVSAAPPAAGIEQRFVIDTWFFDNGLPAVVLPLNEWMEGAGPSV